MKQLLSCVCLAMMLGCVRLSTLPSPAIVEVARTTASYTAAPSPPIVEVPRTRYGTSTSQQTMLTASGVGDRTPAVIFAARPRVCSDTLVVKETPLLPPGRPTQ
jgi:hypothetical protein